jgi:hypothetical protein
MSRLTATLSPAVELNVFPNYKTHQGFFNGWKYHQNNFHILKLNIFSMVGINITIELYID